MKYLKEKYKTYEGALKRCGFENGIAKSEFDRGYKAKHYHYTIAQDDAGMWRVVRNNPQQAKPASEQWPTYRPSK